VLEKRTNEICEISTRACAAAGESWSIDQEDLSRLSRDGLQLRDKTPKRPIKAKLRDDRQVATQATEIWALDFVHDQLVIVRKSRVPRWSTPTSRFSPVIDPRLGYRGEDVLHVLKKGCFQAGYPATIRVD
jgi:putative transposase